MQSGVLPSFAYLLLPSILPKQPERVKHLNYSLNLFMKLMFIINHVNICFNHIFVLQPFLRQVKRPQVHPVNTAVVDIPVIKQVQFWCQKSILLLINDYR